MSWCNIIHCERNVLQTRSENSENIGKGFFYYDLSSDARRKHFYRLENHSKLTFFFPPLYISDNHGQRFWDWAFSSSHIGPTSPLTPQTMLDACIQNSFRVSICTGWGEGITARKFRKGCTVLWRNTEWRKNMNIALLSQEVLSMTVVSGEDMLFF